MKLFFYIALVSIFFATNTFGGDAVIGDLRIEHAWTRVPPGVSKITAGYLTIYNNGEEQDSLIGGTIKVAKQLEIHEMKLTDGVMKMRPVVNGIPIPPNSSVELKPGGFHLMFTNLTKPLKEGQSIPVSLIFENAGEVTVMLDVAGVGATEVPINHSHGN